MRLLYVMDDLSLIVKNKDVKNIEENIVNLRVAISNTLSSETFYEKENEKN